MAILGGFGFRTDFPIPTFPVTSSLNSWNKRDYSLKNIRYLGKFSKYYPQYGECIYVGMYTEERKLLMPAFFWLRQLVLYTFCLSACALCILLFRFYSGFIVALFIHVVAHLHCCVYLYARYFNKYFIWMSNFLFSLSLSLSSHFSFPLFYLFFSSILLTPPHLRFSHFSLLIIHFCTWW